eukprot:TRINITY_DN33965_c0_g1_i2.p1 TRINITY_DN33965_c0_g1~~TRINITY_DN33965_c0_g1_i2.p1  ORF type:complete len:637 (+),score=189.09 TRINITY_DN33965_c0_g1_i2:87-1913(+)
MAAARGALAAALLCAVCGAAEPKSSDADEGLPGAPEGSTAGPWRGGVKGGGPDVDALKEDEDEIKARLDGSAAYRRHRSILFLRLAEDAPLNVTEHLERSMVAAASGLDYAEWGVNHSPLEGLGLGRPSHVAVFSFNRQSARAWWGGEGAVAAKLREALLPHAQLMVGCDYAPKAGPEGLPSLWEATRRPLALRHAEGITFKPEAPARKLAAEYAATVAAALADGIPVRSFERGSEMGQEALGQGPPRPGSPLSYCFVTTFANRSARDAWVDSPRRQALRKSLAPHVLRSAVADYDATPTVSSGQPYPSLPPTRRLLLLAAKHPGSAGEAVAWGFAEAAAAAQPHATAVEWGTLGAAPGAPLPRGVSAGQLTHAVLVSFADGRRGRDAYARDQAMGRFQMLSGLVSDGLTLDYDVAEGEGALPPPPEHRISGGDEAAAPSAAGPLRLLILFRGGPAAVAALAKSPCVEAVEWGVNAAPLNLAGPFEAAAVATLRGQADCLASDRLWAAAAAAHDGAWAAAVYSPAPQPVAHDTFETAPLAEDGEPDLERLREWRVRQLEGYLAARGAPAPAALGKAGLLHAVRKAAERRRMPAAEGAACSEGEQCDAK